MIFDGLKPADGDDCLQSAVSAVLGQARRCGLWPARTRWSLAELAPDEADLAWLKAWAWQLRGTTLLPWINSWRQHKEVELSGAGSVGLLLLLLAAEAARREATEGTLWPTVERQYAGDVRRLLFLHGQPTVEHKQALESAAWELGLRHVFGIDGLHNWVTSVYLQFGFTRRGFEANLPLWMTAPQNRSNAVEGLLEGTLQSASFQEMWSALSGYRRRNISAARLETVLEHSSWLLPEWRESLIRLAQTKMHLGGGQSDNGIGQAQAAPDFLDAPTLRWDGVGPPEFICHWQLLTELSLPNDEYTLIIDGRETAKLRRQSDGGFAAQPDGELRLPAIPSQAALLLDAEKNVALTQILMCWDAAEDITAFRLPNGERAADVWVSPLRPEGTYALVLAADLTLNPPAIRWRVTADNKWRFALLPPPRSAETQILIPDGACLWKPVKLNAPVADWTTAISVTVANRATGRRWGETVMVIVDHPADISVQFARCHGQTLACEAADGGTRVGPLTLTPGGRTIVPELTLGLTHGDSHACRRLPLPFQNLVGALHITEGERRPLAPQTVLTTVAAQTDSFQLFADRTWNSADVALFEGDTAVGKPSVRPSTLPPLAGFGAPMSLRSRAYNDREEPLIIAQEVINPGWITGVTQELSDAARTVRVNFKQSIEPDQGHALFWWGCDGVYRLLTLADFCTDSQTGEWQFSVPLEWGKPMVIAVAFEGARLGAWWAEDWDRLLDSTSAATETAALVRWLRLPILSKRSMRGVQQFAREKPADVLAAWVRDDIGLPSSLQWGRTDERWLDAVRQVFNGWQPQVSEARRVLSLLAPAYVGETTIRLQAAARLLMRVDPHLMARVFGVWLQEFSVEKHTLAKTREMCVELRHALAETTGGLDARASRLLEEAAATMVCDDNFVKRGLLEKAAIGFDGQSLTTSDRSNVSLALTVMPFRRLLAIRLLQRVCP